MLIEQYQRRVKPTTSSGNYMGVAREDYSGLRDVGRTMASLGLAGLQKIEQARYQDELSGAKIAFQKKFLDYRNNLGADTKDYLKNLEQMHHDFSHEFTNGRAQSDFEMWLEAEKLDQTERMTAYKDRIDVQNFRNNFNIRATTLKNNAANALDDIEYLGTTTEAIQDLYGVTREDGELKLMDGEYPLVGTGEVRMAYAKSWLQDAEARRTFNIALTLPFEEGEKLIRSLPIPTDDKQSLMNDYDFEKEKEVQNLKAQQEQNYKSFMAQIYNNEPPELNAVRQAWLNGSVTETQKNNLEKALGGGQADDNDPLALRKAYLIMNSDMSPDAKFAGIVALKSKLKKTTFDGFVKDAYEPDEVLSSDFAKEWIKQVDLLFMDENKDIPTEDIPAWAQTQDTVKQIIKDNYPNYNKAQTQIEAVLGLQKEKNARTWLDSVFRLVSPASGVIAGIEDISKFQETKRKQERVGLPRPKTEVEYNALPKGTLYIHPNGSIKRK